LSNGGSENVRAFFRFFHLFGLNLCGASLFRACALAALRAP
jgi:hypothetical protein